MSGKTGNSLLTLIIILALFAALWAGKMKPRPDLTRLVRDIFPEATSIELANGIYSVFRENNNVKELLGWAAPGIGSGYGGPLLSVAGVNTSGKFIGAEVAEHGETYVFFRMARPKNVFKILNGKSFKEITERNYTLEGTTGASRSFEALIGSVENAVTKIAGEKFNFLVPERRKSLEFGFVELALIILFSIGIFASRKKSSIKENLRWFSQSAGLLIIGFWENSPITIAKISCFLLGYFPQVHYNLYWYFLLGGFALTILVLGENIHCLYVCPFGALQRFIGTIGGANKKMPAWAVKLMVGLRNYLVLAVVFLVLLTRKPGLASYEPFGVIFTLNGTILLWLLLVIILISSLIFNTPWCYYFCPMQACTEIIQSFRQRTKLLWKEKLIKGSR